MLIAVHDQSKVQKKASSSSFSRLARSLTHQSPLDALPSPRSRDSYRRPLGPPYCRDSSKASAHKHQSKQVSNKNCTAAHTKSNFRTKDQHKPSSQSKSNGPGGELVVRELTFYQAKWSELFPEFLEIIRKISQGILIAFSDDTSCLLCHPLELHSNNKTSDLLQTLKMLLESRAIEEVLDPSSPGYYSRLFLVPKPGGSFRAIIDLKKLNLYLEVPSFKMETLFSIIAALQPLEWITKINLKDAYQHILVHQNIRKYFRFVIYEKTYQFRVLPFGLSTAPRESPKPSHR